MTAGAKKCVCTHRRAGHDDHRGHCNAFGCWCRRFVARDDTETILEILETIDAEAK